MRRGVIFLTIFILLLIAPTAVRYLQNYQLGSTDRVVPAAYNVAEVVQSVPTPAAAAFIDEPTMLGGLVLLDQAHNNAFTLDEIGFLDGRLAARGTELSSYTGGDLATALRAVNAFVVITPLIPFTTEEIQAVDSFVRRGGHLLMLGDPTRNNIVVEEDFFSFNIIVETDKIPLNSLANSFDIIFNGDYLYNTLENEGNFRNIILTDEGFGDDPVMAGLETVVFYGSHSLQIGAGAETLISGDDDTWSSATDRPGGLTLAAMGANGRVVAIGDIQFLTEPYYTVYDNGRFIAQIADFLAEPVQRDYTVADFPYFFAENIALVYTGSPDLGPGAFDEIINLQDSLRVAEKEITLATNDNLSGDAIYLGIYNQADDVADLLADAGISLLIEPEILTADEQAALEEAEREDDQDVDDEDVEEEDAGTEDDETAVSDEDEEESDEESEETIRLIQAELGNVQMSGTALILLDESGGQRRLIVLAASGEGLESVIGRLLDLIPLNASYALADCLLQDNLALCPTNVAGEEVEAELDTGGTSDTIEGTTDNDEETAEEIDEPPIDDEPPAAEIVATDQGIIGLGETVEGILPADEKYSWIFQDGPIVIDITVVAGDDIDAVLELYDSDNNLLEAADAGFTGDDETIIGANIPDDGEYIIVVSDFFGNGGEFSLTVAESSELPIEDEGDSGDIGSSGETTIFLFIDDDGEAIDSGFTAQDAFETLLGSDYSVTTWVTSLDGPLTADELETADLLIWESGDYLNPDGFFDEDTLIVFEYIDSGRPILITGSSPTIFGDIGLTALSDVEFSGDDDTLLAGFVAGETLLLDDTYQVVSAGFVLEDVQDGSIPFLLRGSGSEDSESIIGLASTDEFNFDQQTILLMLPFSVLPEDAQTTLLNNMMTWFSFATP
jgi:predicted  nucleic acid-binding Zn-ribbon protein